MATDTVAHNTVTFRDSRGKTGRSSFYTIYDPAIAQDGRDATAVLNVALEGCSNAAPIRAVGLAGDELAPDSYGTTGVYSTIEDRVEFTFLSADGTLHKIGVPAPKASIFYTDGDTVDPTNANVVAVKNAVLIPLTTANISDRNGRGFTAYVAGTRRRSPLQRKQTLWWKNPAETGPDE